jgi:hypothetical protein
MAVHMHITHSTNLYVATASGENLKYPGIDWETTLHDAATCRKLL